MLKVVKEIKTRKTYLYKIKVYIKNNSKNNLKIVYKMQVRRIQPLE